MVWMCKHPWWVRKYPDPDLPEWERDPPSDNDELLAKIKEADEEREAQQEVEDLGPNISFPRSPVWCFTREGDRHTLLPDGRTAYIGGEHEDSYDPMSCIYNDVIVTSPSSYSTDGPEEYADTITIYGYPESVFPPTDFPTATSRAWHREGVYLCYRRSRISWQCS